MRKDNQWYPARVIAVADACDGVREILLDAGMHARAFTVGSHLDFRLCLDGREDLRSYSLVGEPRTDGRYLIAVRAMPDSRGGSRHMWTLAPGDTIETSAPSNNFPLGEHAPELLLVAGGIGITPILGMAQRLARHHPAFRLLYAGRTREAMAYLPLLQDLLGERLRVYCDDEAGAPDLAAASRRPPKSMSAARWACSKRCAGTGATPDDRARACISKPSATAATRRRGRSW